MAPAQKQKKSYVMNNMFLPSKFKKLYSGKTLNQKKIKYVILSLIKCGEKISLREGKA